jgi:hypothetical protein
MLYNPAHLYRVIELRGSDSVVRFYKQQQSTPANNAGKTSEARK